MVRDAATDAQRDRSIETNKLGHVTSGGLLHARWAPMMYVRPFWRQTACKPMQCAIKPWQQQSKVFLESGIIPPIQTISHLPLNLRATKLFATSATGGPTPEFGFSTLVYKNMIISWCSIYFSLKWLFHCKNMNCSTKLYNSECRLM